MAIEYKKVIELQEAWRNNQTCNYPRFEKELFGIVTDLCFIET